MRKNKQFTIAKYWFCVSWPLIQKSTYPDWKIYTFGFTFRVGKTHLKQAKYTEVFDN